jgi:hypothetical protein
VWHVWETREVRRGFWWGNLEEIDHLEDLSVGERVISKWIFNKLDGGHELDRCGSG